MAYRRRNRILCLHGPTQSAASFRAALKPVCDTMESNWEFHFLDAPFIIPDSDDVHGHERQSNVWSQSAILASRVTALDSELANTQGTSIDELQRARAHAWNELSSSQEGRQVFEAQERGGADSVESLVSTKVAKSMSRDWVARTLDGDGRPVGVDVSLTMIGDYMREQGTFHGAIGYDSGGTVALLLQALLSHPRSSSKTFPTFFAQLPQGVTRLPRMGGWEEEPPAPDDVRLGPENLTRDYVPAQKPFEVLVAYCSDTQAVGRRTHEWLAQKQPILHTVAPDAFHSHSLAIHHGDKGHRPLSLERELRLASQDAFFDQRSTKLLAEYLILALGTCQGDETAGKQLHSLKLDRLSAPAPAKL